MKGAIAPRNKIPVLLLI